MENRDIDKLAIAQMGDTIGAITHQWQQPLNSIALLSSLLRLNITKIDPRDMDIDEYIKQRDKKVIEYNKKLDEQLGFMSQTIDDFRSFLKPDKEKVLFSLSKQLELIIRIVEPVLKNEDITLNITKDQSLIDTIFGYPSEFGQAFLSIINNSIDAIVENDPIDRSIKISIKEVDTKMVIEVEDFAGGIDNSIIDKVFDNHFTTKNKNGTGIGLYISKNILENMDATITALNSKVGAIFTITFNK